MFGLTVVSFQDFFDFYNEYLCIIGHALKSNHVSKETCVYFNWSRLLIGKNWMLIVIMVHYGLSDIYVEHITMHVLII